MVIFLAMGCIFPACSVSNEMVEIFGENASFFISFAVWKTGTGLELVGRISLGCEGRAAAQLRLFSWPGLDGNSH